LGNGKPVRSGPAQSVGITCPTGENKNGQKTANFFGKTCLEKMASNMNSLGGHVKDTHQNESL
jgi:hypothetical protein